MILNINKIGKAPIFTIYIGNITQIARITRAMPYHQLTHSHIPFDGGIFGSGGEGDEEVDGYGSVLFKGMVRKKCNYLKVGGVKAMKWKHIVDLLPNCTMHTAFSRFSIKLIAFV